MRDMDIGRRFPHRFGDAGADSGKILLTLQGKLRIVYKDGDRKEMGGVDIGRRIVAGYAGGKSYRGGDKKLGGP